MIVINVPVVPVRFNLLPITTRLTRHLAQPADNLLLRLLAFGPRALPNAFLMVLVIIPKHRRRADPAHSLPRRRIRKRVARVRRHHPPQPLDDGIPLDIPVPVHFRFHEECAHGVEERVRERPDEEGRDGNDDPRVGAEPCTDGVGFDRAFVEETETRARDGGLCSAGGAGVA